MTQGKRDNFPWGHMVWLQDGEGDDLPDMSVARMVLNPGATAEKHLHNNCHEFITVTSGSMTITVDGETKDMDKDDTILIPPHTAHYVKNTTNQPVQLMLVYSTSKRNYTSLE